MRGNPWEWRAWGAAIGICASFSVGWSALQSLPIVGACVVVLVPAMAWASGLWLAPTWSQLPRRDRWLAAAGWLVGGLWLTVVIPIHPRWQSAVLAVLLEAGGIVGLGGVLAVAITVLVVVDRPHLRPDHSRWWLFAIPPWALWSVALSAMWPGGMSSDSFDQWSQIFTHQFNDWHPFAHTALLWLATRIAPTPAAVALVQIAIGGAVVGWVGALFHRAGIRASIVLAVISFFALLPGSQIVLIVWKDSAYAILLLALTASCFEAVLDRNVWERRVFQIRIVALSTLAALIRSNAPLAAFGVFCVAFTLFPQRIRIVNLFVVGLALWLSVKAIQPTFGITPAPTKLPWWYVHQIAAHQAGRTPIGEEDARLFRTLAPSNDGKWSYDPFLIDATVFSPTFEPYLLADEKVIGEITRTWRTLLLSNPSVNIRHIATAGMNNWQVVHPPSMHIQTLPLFQRPDGIWSCITGEEVVPHSDNNPIDIPTTRPASLVLNRFVGVLYQRAARGTLSWLAFGGALPLYILLLGALVSGLRSRSWSVVFVASPATLNALGLMLFSVSAEFRFTSPVFFVGMLFGPLLLLLPTAKVSGASAPRFAMALD